MDPGETCLEHSPFSISVFTLSAAAFLGVNDLFHGSGAAI